MFLYVALCWMLQVCNQIIVYTLEEIKSEVKMFKKKSQQTTKIDDVRMSFLCSDVDTVSSAHLFGNILWVDL